MKITSILFLLSILCSSALAVETEFVWKKAGDWSHVLTNDKLTVSKNGEFLFTNAYSDYLFDISKGSIVYHGYTGFLYYPIDDTLFISHQRAHDISYPDTLALFNINTLSLSDFFVLRNNGRHFLNISSLFFDAEENILIALGTWEGENIKRIAIWDFKNFKLKYDEILNYNLDTFYDEKVNELLIYHKFNHTLYRYNVLSHKLDSNITHNETSKKHLKATNKYILYSYEFEKQSYLVIRDKITYDKIDEIEVDVDDCFFAIEDTVYYLHDMKLNKRNIINKEIYYNQNYASYEYTRLKKSNYGILAIKAYEEGLIHLIDFSNGRIINTLMYNNYTTLNVFQDSLFVFGNGVYNLDGEVVYWEENLVRYPKVSDNVVYYLSYDFKSIYSYNIKNNKRKTFDFQSKVGDFDVADEFMLLEFNDSLFLYNTNSDLMKKLNYDFDDFLIKDNNVYFIKKNSFIKKLDLLSNEIETILDHNVHYNLYLQRLYSSNKNHIFLKNYFYNLSEKKLYEMPDLSKEPVYNPEYIEISENNEDFYLSSEYNTDNVIYHYNNKEQKFNKICDIDLEVKTDYYLKSEFERKDHFQKKIFLMNNENQILTLAGSNSLMLWNLDKNTSVFDPKKKKEKNRNIVIIENTIPLLDNVDYQIYDLAGKLLIKNRAPQIDVSWLTPGTYITILVYENKIRTFLFIKK